MQWLPDHAGSSWVCVAQPQECEHKSTLQFTTSCDLYLTESSFKKESLDSCQDLFKNINQIEKGYSLVPIDSAFGQASWGSNLASATSGLGALRSFLASEPQVPHLYGAGGRGVLWRRDGWGSVQAAFTSWPRCSFIQRYKASHTRPST